MSGDYSRIRFDPYKDIASVWMQQGRVQLDSDWNEGMAALDRRLRAESVDTFGVHPVPGRTGVAVVSPQTPDAFKIEWDGASLTIGSGRMYVDGLLVENHGHGENGGEVFDPVLAELRREGALPYEEQSYFCKPLPDLPTNGRHLAYLEVWQRELTHLQYPEMVENAVGVDTTTRWQTVWQVRFLMLDGESREGEETPVNCSTPDDQIPEWQLLTHPSASRMSIRAVAAPSNTEPCELPPSGGYRGLENQLYRIEIHDGGPAGKATFKWSRDNASVASAVVEVVSDTELKLASLGRDTELCFNTDDWVEILDDRCELNGENSNPVQRRGVMRKIAVDNAKQTIEFSPALPADLIPKGGDDTLSARHTRVRRWDQEGAVRDTEGKLIVNLDDPGSNGLIPVPTAGVWVELEKGIQIQFSLDLVGSEFHSGDYWVSAARTADTSIEDFENVPPRGIHRHYARLAIIDFDNDSPVVSDCRIHWPPACGGGGCCTVTVAPSESIQDALNALPDEGGCVCLKTGVHDISNPIQINRSNVILQGESPGSIVRSNEVALIIGGKVDSVVVKRIRFEAVAQSETSFSLLQAVNCEQLQVIECEFINESSSNRMISGLILTQVTNVTVTRNRIRNMWNGIMIEGSSKNIDIQDNFLEGNGVEVFLEFVVVPEIVDEALASLERAGSGIRISSREISEEIFIKSNRFMRFYAGININMRGIPEPSQLDVVVDGNFITECGYGIAGIEGKNNRIRNNHIDTTDCGIWLFKESNPEISGNHLYSCGWGILLSELNGTVALLNNRLMNCGFLPSGEGKSFSIYIDNNNQGEEENKLPNNVVFRIEGCEIIDTGVDANSQFGAAPACGIHIHDSLAALQITNNRINYTVTSSDVEGREYRALRLVRNIAEGESFPPLSGVLITGNQFRGYGYFALVEVDLLGSTVAPSCIFSNNVCDHLNTQEEPESATVVLKGARSGTHFVVMGNQITSPKREFSLLFKPSNPSNSRVICIGNRMTGDIELSNSTIIPSPYKDFNIIGIV
ncbi:DUF6519 domain-containing protein [Nitrosomonas sp.]|uniref:DUF6519 domain-containing protein n=1 Tax=Nitrosomonas sp. TaxID=42353 RepID=UPI0037C51DB1